MRVEQLMTKQVTTCKSTDTLDQAARLMWEHDCGCLPVCVSDGTICLVGIITDQTSSAGSRQLPAAHMEFG